MWYLRIPSGRTCISEKMWRRESRRDAVRQGNLFTDDNKTIIWNACIVGITFLFIRPILPCYFVVAVLVFVFVLPFLGLVIRSSSLLHGFTGWSAAQRRLAQKNKSSRVREEWGMWRRRRSKDERERKEKGKEKKVRLNAIFSPQDLNRKEWKLKFRSISYSIKDNVVWMYVDYLARQAGTRKYLEKVATEQQHHSSARERGPFRFVSLSVSWVLVF